MDVSEENVVTAECEGLLLFLFEGCQAVLSDGKPANNLARPMTLSIIGMYRSRLTAAVYAFTKDGCIALRQRGSGWAGNRQYENRKLYGFWIS